ncbi:MAG: tetratricopeptide repeat protein [Candidatus Marinimicrobia bacterium]|jgi:Tfp pilus assembly protein PilF|nr:tetratricopeptide repeat protein [Candidatus Neomarinimicrobiota bacterium]
MEKTDYQLLGEKFQQQVVNNTHLLRALEYYQERDYPTARMFLEMVVKEDPSTDVYYLLALLEENEGKIKQAVGWLNSALEMTPDSADLYNMLGKLLVKEGKQQEAVNLFKQALDIQSNHIGALQNLSLSLKELDCQQASLETSERLLAIHETEAVCNNHGTILHEMNRKEEALKYFERAIVLNPNSAEAYGNAGGIMLELGHPEFAIAHLKHAITLDSSPSLYRNLSSAYIAVNRYGEAWDMVHHTSSYTGKPEWKGEALQGKKLFVSAEQGLGDEIMFASMIPDLSKEDGEVIVQCDPRLDALYQRSFPGIKVLGVDRKDIDQLMEVDYESVIGELPRFYRRSLDAFPVRDGYLKADPQKVLYWKNRLDQLGEGLKIGVCWSSGLAEKIRKHWLNSISSINRFYPLLNIPGVTVISLQYTDVTEELKIVKEETGNEVVLLDGIDMKNDQDSLAALMVALNLTFSIHTAVLQMAAAVKGANVWAIPANNSPFHRLMKSPVTNDFDEPVRDLEELFSKQIEAATSILTKATKRADPAGWITEVSNQVIENGRIYP